MNLAAIDDLCRRFPDLDLVLVESGGDNLAATFSPELADLTIYVIDVAEGEKIPRKGGPGITRSDLLVINKIDLAPHVGASLEVMDRDARRMRGERPFVFTNMREGTGVVIDNNGLVLTIGYLILEAETIELSTANGRSFPATVVGYDAATGFGLTDGFGAPDWRALVGVRYTRSVARAPAQAAAPPAVLDEAPPEVAPEAAPGGELAPNTGCTDEAREGEDGDEYQCVEIDD